MYVHFRWRSFQLYFVKKINDVINFHRCGMSTTKLLRLWTTGAGLASGNSDIVDSELLVA
jgi:hypothetical protein